MIMTLLKPLTLPSLSFGHLLDYFRLDGVPCQWDASTECRSHLSNQSSFFPCEGLESCRLNVCMIWLHCIFKHQVSSQLKSSLDLVLREQQIQVSHLIPGQLLLEWNVLHHLHCFPLYRVKFCQVKCICCISVPASHNMLTFTPSFQTLVDHSLFRQFQLAFYASRYVIYLFCLLGSNVWPQRDTYWPWLPLLPRSAGARQVIPLLLSNPSPSDFEKQSSDKSRWTLPVLSAESRERAWAWEFNRPGSSDTTTLGVLYKSL